MSEETRRQKLLSWRLLLPLVVGVVWLLHGAAAAAAAANQRVSSKNIENHDRRRLPASQIAQRFFAASGNKFKPPQTSNATVCTVMEFRCVNSGNKCIKQEQVCDGVADCADKSDEKNCEWCNRTVSNEKVQRMIIQTPQLAKLSSGVANFAVLNCYYQIINAKPSTIVGIHMRKFSVGVYSREAKKCQNAWIEINESDQVAAAAEDHSASPPTKQSSKAASAPKPPTTLSRRYSSSSTTDSSLNNANRTGDKFCGTLHNFWTSFYSAKRTVTLEFVSSKLLSVWNSNQSQFEFEIIFYESESLSPVKFSKILGQQRMQQQQQASPGYRSEPNVAGRSSAEDYDSENTLNQQQQQQSSSASFFKFNYGKPVADHYCSRTFANCSTASSHACLITSPGYPGIYLKNISCQFNIFNNNNNSAKYRNSNNPNENNNKNERLILISDNLQLDGSMCSYRDPIKALTSYFCDRGPRVSADCQDYLNIYDSDRRLIMGNVCGMGRLPKLVTRSSQVSVELVTASDGLFANHGFLFYALSERSYFDNYNLFNRFERGGGGEIRNEWELSALKAIERLQIENCEWSGRECALTVTDEMLDEIYSGKTTARRPPHDAGEEAAEEEEFEAENALFRIGYLFGMNQYHADAEGFTLRYAVKSKRFNTIAIYLEKFKPSGMVSQQQEHQHASTSNDCEENYLSIETSNQLLSKNSYSMDYEYTDQDPGETETDPYELNKLLHRRNTTRRASTAASGNGGQSTVHSRRRAENSNAKSSTRKVLLTRLCQPLTASDALPAPAASSPIRSFLIKSLGNSQSLHRNVTGKVDGSRRSSRLSKTNAIINYHVTGQKQEQQQVGDLISPNRLLDFKVTFEFLHFDWQAYQENSVCDFIYNFNLDSTLPLAGFLANPKASIFYKPTSGESLQCRYRLVARYNFYIKLTVEYIDFEKLEKSSGNAESNGNKEAANELCENVYYNSTNWRDSEAACSRLSKKLIIREPRKPLSANSIENEMFFDSYEDSSSAASDDDDDDDDDAYDQPPHQRRFVNRICLCRANRYFKPVYVSKYDSLEIEYNVRLSSSSVRRSALDADQRLRQQRNFRVRYEVLPRNCHKLVFANLKSSLKGKLVYIPHQGVQTELVSFLNQSSLTQLLLTDTEKRHLVSDEKVEKDFIELETLKDTIRSNVNFYCKFFLKAPKNSFIHLEFAQLSLGQPLETAASKSNGGEEDYTPCDENNIKLYSNFTRFGLNTLESYFHTKPSPLLRLCSTKMKNLTPPPQSPSPPSRLANNKRNSAAAYPPPPSQLDKSLVVAEFYEESIVNSSFSCYDAKNRICFLTSDIRSELNPSRPSLAAAALNLNAQLEDFHNQMAIELLANNLNKLYFEIKYYFYRIDQPPEVSVKSEAVAAGVTDWSTSSSAKKMYWKSLVKNRIGLDRNSIGNEMSRNSNAVEAENEQQQQHCDFKCFTGVLVNAELANSSIASQVKRICLDESLVCDGEVDCIFNGLDEFNCPFKLNAKTILIVLCSLFGFTFTVLLIFYFYRKILNEMSNNGEQMRGFKSSASESRMAGKAKYSRASQIDCNNAEDD